MLVVVFCVMMKILEYSSGILIEADKLGPPNGFKKKRQRKRRKGLGRGMTTVDELSVSPASDCNSNNVDASYTSTTSDVEFIQDNCDYQWFPDYGYREVHHRSVLSSCYDELARDLDSQLAQVDMEDYSAQDILSTLPTMCCTEIQTERRGEMFASVSGSLMVRFEFDSSLSPHTSSQDESSMSLCQSEPLFSPVKEAPLFPTNYSVDSLDCEDQDHLIVTCQANKHNYTIAFHGSTVMEDGSDLDTGESLGFINGSKKAQMAASDAPTTTWSKLRTIHSRTRQRSKTVSLPDLAPPSVTTSLALGCMKLYDINSCSVNSGSFSCSNDDKTLPTQKQGNFSLLRMFMAQRNNHEQNDNKNRSKGNPIRNANELSSMTDAAWMDELSACYEDSLVKDNSGEPESSSVERLSSKSISICSCSMSSNKFNVNNNNSFEREPQKHNAKVGTSGSDLSETTTSSEPTGATKVVITERKCPIHCIDRSMQTSSHGSNVKVTPKELEGGKKPVYVLYPNYTLPDLEFLRKNCFDLDRVLLTPLKFSGNHTPSTPPASNAPHRTVTKKDVEMLCQKGLSHVVDWTSLTPLLPAEYWSILAEVPEIRQHAATRFGDTRPLFCATPTTSKDFPQFSDGKNVNSSGCSTGTAPSSGYRGSSTLLNESGGNSNPNPLYVYNYGTEEKNKTKKNKTSEIPENKRYSMFEFGAIDDAPQDVSGKKRKSFPNQHIALKDICDDEMWEDWWKDSKQRPHSPPSAHAQRLDELIELSGHEQWYPSDIRALKDEVSKFLSEVGKKCVSFADNNDQQLTPPNSPAYQKGYQCKQGIQNDSCNTSENKKSLIDGVAEAVDKIINYTESNVSQIVLDTLCPTLYAVMTDGLKPQLDTPFGPIGNSVWQVVEASAQQGPMTRALNELVMKLNSEDVLSEGLVKFNAFVFGLLNVRGLDAWISYVRTRESVLSKHYVEDSILLGASKGQATYRSLTNQLINTIKPLSQCNFGLDLLYETRMLHESLLQLARLPLSPNQNVETTADSYLFRRIMQSIRSGLGNLSSTEQSETTASNFTDSKSTRPRSCIDAVGGADLASTARKRWSGVQVGSRLANAFDRLQSDDEFPDSLETEGKSSTEEASEREEEPSKDRGGKFRSLQRKWEMLSGREGTCSDSSPVKSNNSSARSRIPRPVTSPVRPQSRLPTPISNQKRTPTQATTQRPKSGQLTRPSRADIPLEKVVTSRPSSLPYRAPGGAAKVQRRAASSSTVRKSTCGPRHVVTLTHRLPVDSGHLAFNEGERLRLVLEVDDVWLLCCRGDQKGLVPRSAVI